MRQQYVIIDKTDRSLHITLFIQRHVFIIHLGEFKQVFLSSAKVAVVREKCLKNEEKSGQGNVREFHFHRVKKKRKNEKSLKNQN